MRRFAKPVLLIVVLFVVGAAGAAAMFIRARIYEPYKGFAGEEQFLEVPTGTSSPAIGRLLIDAGVVRDELTFRAALLWTGRSQGLQAGEYRFDRASSAVTVIERIARGDVYARRLTFPEGLTINEMSRVYE